MLNIPQNILETARQSGVQDPAVSAWFRERIIEAGVSFDASPADWPQELWDTYKTLREAHEPGACGGSAKRLFETLDFGDK